MLLHRLAQASVATAATASRLEKTAVLAEVLADLAPAEIVAAVAWLSGDLTQRQIGVGWSSLREMPTPSAAPTLTIETVEYRFSTIGATSGAGSKNVRAKLLGRLMESATGVEQSFLRRLLGGELRQGALGAIMLDAIARAADISPLLVRRAAMLHGDLPAVAHIALVEGSHGLQGVRLEVGRAVAPMLAQPATSIQDALDRLGDAAWEQKLDGARIQVHRDGENVSIFTRTLDDVTDRLPEVVTLVRQFDAHTFVLDGEVLMMRDGGRPYPFQVTASRFGSRTSTNGLLTPFFFDVLHIDGTDVIDESARQRAEILQRLVPSTYQVRRIVTAEATVASEFFADALASGHEGIVAKSLDSPYEAGRRGGAWLKVKPVHTLDLVVLAVEWGSGRRTGLLSNIHLGARDAGTGEFVMLGKTFKGMTDATLGWQTTRFAELARSSLENRVVELRPEQVVEIAFDGVQRSTRYPGGVALRFARVVRYRDDKAVGEIDTIDAVRTLLM